MFTTTLSYHSYAESGFFFRWWREQPAFVHEQVRQVVNNGQLEFIGGGWVQNDEAATYYQATIDQVKGLLHRSKHN